MNHRQQGTANFRFSCFRHRQEFQFWFFSRFCIMKTVENPNRYIIIDHCPISGAMFKSNSPHVTEFSRKAQSSLDFARTVRLSCTQHSEESLTIDKLSIQSTVAVLWSKKIIFCTPRWIRFDIERRIVINNKQWAFIVRLGWWKHFNWVFQQES